MKKTTRSFLLFVLVATSPLCAMEQEPNIVGERGLTQEEKIELKMQRRSEQACEDCDKEEEPPVVILPIVVEPRDISTEDGVSQKSTQKPTYYTSHPDVVRHPFLVTAFGDIVELDDESRWLVRPADCMKTLNWLTSDTIILLPPGWFSSNQYAMYNVDTNVRINVDLVKQPRFNGVKTHWVIAIDYANRRVCLEDGSIWDVILSDKVLLGKWLPDDLIIIGSNDGIFSSSSRPNILINANLNEYVRGKCVYY